MNLLDRYPRVKHFLETHPGVNLDQALVLTEIELRKLGKDKTKE